MTENHKQSDSGIPNDNSSGVLFLKNPGETKNSVEWYSSKIAGVPFILRNLLTLQRAGIKNLAVFMEDPHGGLEKSFEKLLKDSRLPKNITWTNNIPQLKEWTQNNPTYIFNGSALHDKKKLHNLIHSHSKNEGASAFPINLKKLDELLTDNPTAIQSQQTGFPLYVPGAKEAEIQNPEDFKRLHEAQVGGSGLSHDSPITFVNTYVFEYPNQSKPNYSYKLFFRAGFRFPFLSRFLWNQCYRGNVAGFVNLGRWSRWRNSPLKIYGNGYREKTGYLL